MAKEVVQVRVDAEAECATGKVCLEAQIDQEVVVEQVENGQDQTHRHEDAQFLTTRYCLWFLVSYVL